MRLALVPSGHRVIDPSDPDLRTIADVGLALGIRFDFIACKHWCGPWRIVRGRWQRPYGDPEHPYIADGPWADRSAEKMHDYLSATGLLIASLIATGGESVPSETKQIDGEGES